MSLRKPLPLVGISRRTPITATAGAAARATGATSATGATAASTAAAKKTFPVRPLATPGAVAIKKRPKQYTKIVRDEEVDPREDIPFLYYPEKEDLDYQRDIFRKWEFRRSKVSDNFAKTKIEELCGKRVLWPYQEFLRNFLSKETPYNSALLWHGVGTGKTCSAITVAEALRPYIEAAKKNIYIIAPQHVEENFKKELYDFGKEMDEEALKLAPGSLQCTGLTYYLPPVGKDKEKARKNAIKARIFGPRSVYKFFGIGTKFPNYVRDLKENYDANLAQVFSDSLFIIDEAHRVVTKEGIGKDQPEDVFSEIMSGVPSTETKARKARRARKRTKTEGSDSEGSESGTESEGSDTEDTKKKGRGRKKKTAEEEIPSPKLLPLLKEIFRVAKNTKVLMLTATPIQDDPESIIEIINLLRINNKEPELMTADNLFPRDIYDTTLTPQEKIDKDYFNRMTKGYISYIRGENPVSFPEVRVPVDGYTPHCLVDITGTKTIVPIPLNVKLGLVRCPMNYKTQYTVHEKWVHKSGGGRGMIHLGIPGLMITTVTYPNPASTEDPLSGNAGFFRVFAKNNQPGPISGSLATATAKSVVAAAARGRTFGGKGGKGKRVIVQFKWQGGKNGMQFLWHENIYPYSTKFYSLLNNIGNPNRGITFIYVSFVESGAIITAMFLEANGYVRYHHEDSFKRNEKTGRYDNITAPYPLISYQSYKDNNMPRRYRCYRCCKLDEDPIHTNTGLGPDGTPQSNPNYIKPSSKEGSKEDSKEAQDGSKEDDDPQGVLPHKFEQGVYSLYLATGSTALREEELDRIRSTENRFGKRIKFLLGSRIIGEGVNLYNVRQAHLIDPWHNMTKAYQARGRAIRNCSHKELPEYNPTTGEKMRNVTVYEYCASVPEYFEGQEEYANAVVKEYLSGNTAILNTPIVIDGEDQGMTAVPILTETIDEEIFHRAWGKDIVIKYLERLSKINAFDCNLFKSLNYFPEEDKKRKGSRQCEYMDCNFECTWEPKPGEEDQLGFLNYDTYNLFFSKTQVDRAIQSLREIFKRYSGGLEIDDIIYLVKNVDPGIDEEYIYQALDELLGDPPGRLPMQLTDKMNRNGKLVYQGSAYIFQPNDIRDERAPIRYRLKPLQIKTRSGLLPLEISEEEAKKQVEAKETDHQTIALTKLNKLLEEYRSDPNIVEIRPYDIERVLDTLPPVELSYLFHTLYTKYPDPSYNAFKGLVLEYLAKRFMLLLAKQESGEPTKAGIDPLGTIDRNFQSSLKKGNPPPKKKEKAEIRYTIIGNRIDQTETMHIDPKNPGNVIFTPVDQQEPRVTQAIDTMQRLATDNDLSEVAYGFFDEKMGKFKVSFTGEERITFNTKTDKVSQRSIAKGKVITTYNRQSLIQIFDSLNDLLEIQGRPDLEHIDGSSLGTEELAQTIEQALRILDFASAEEAIETGDPHRIKYILYPYQHLEGCRTFSNYTLPNGEVKGLHQSLLATRSAKFYIDKCVPKPEETTPIEI